MKRLVLLTIFVSLFAFPSNGNQLTDSTDVYLLTCAPGTEAYSIYGHTALRVVIKNSDFDRVYNWGVFDFETPHFVFRFAKGNLMYMLGAYEYTDFINSYVPEKRSVWSQKINLTSDDKVRLFALINENIKPENIKYRYDFFFDNCATRVRDIIENAVADSIVYNVKDEKKSTFRDLINPFQEVLPWLDFGADFLLGLQSDRKASVRDEMFLPMHLMENISSGVIIRDGNRVPILGSPETVIDFTGNEKPKDRHNIPMIILYGVLAFIILVTFVLGVPFLGKVSDVIVFFIYSLLALLLIFTNLFSDHDALHFNLLIIALNPIIPVLSVKLLMKRKAITLSRISLVLAMLYFPAALVAGQGINPAIIPLVLILVIRLFKHCEFGKSF